MRLQFGGLRLNIADNRNRTINSDCPLKIIRHFEHVGPIYLSFLCIFIGPSKNIFRFFPEKSSIGPYIHKFQTQYTTTTHMST